MHKINGLVSEYLALAQSLRRESPISDYRRANELSYLLAMTLPADLYRHIGIAVSKPTPEINPFTCVIEMRTLNNLSGLTQEHVIGHAPGIGERKIKDA